MSTEGDLSLLKTISPELITRIFNIFLYHDKQPPSPDINCSQSGNLILCSELLSKPWIRRRERQAIMGQAIASSNRFFHQLAVEALWTSVTISDGKTLQAVRQQIYNPNAISKPEWRGPKTRVLHLELANAPPDYFADMDRLLAGMPGLQIVINRNSFGTDPSLYHMLLATNSTPRLVRVDATNGVGQWNSPTIRELARMINAFPLRCLQVDCLGERVQRLDPIRENQALRSLCIGGEDCGGGSRMRRLLDALVLNRPLRVLDELHIHKYVLAFRRFLQAYGPQLTILVFDFDPSEEEREGDVGHGVIDLCPNLQDLRCTTLNGFQVGGQSLIPTNHAALRKIKLIFKHDGYLPKLDVMIESMEVVMKGRFESLEKVQVVLGQVLEVDSDELAECIAEYEERFGDCFSLEYASIT